MERVNLKRLRADFPGGQIRKKFPKANAVLLFLTLLIIFVVPVFPKNYYVNYLLITGIFLSAVSLLKKNHRLLVGVSILLPLLVLIARLIDLEILGDVSRTLQFFFFLFLVANIIIRVSRIAGVTLEVIIESIVGYLLLGFAFTIIVSMASMRIPHAYNISLNNDDQMYVIQDNIYYTFVTFTTIGYGDILPTHPVSKSLTILISISGQLYLAVIIAMLVGKYASIGKETL